MIARLAGYFISITAAAMLVSTAQSVIPSEKIRKVATLAGGALLLLCVVSPLLSLDEMQLSLDFSAYLSQKDGEIAQMQVQSEQQLDVLIKSTTEEYISDKAAQLGARVRAEVRTERADTLCSVPAAVTVTGYLNDAQKAELSAYLEDVLGIPKERQVFRTG